MAQIKKYKKYLTISALIWAACFAVFALAYFFVLDPAYQEKKHIVKELKKCQSDYELAKDASQQETKIRMNQELENLQDKLQSFVVDFKSSADLNFDISRIAAECKVSSFNIQGDNRKDPEVSIETNGIFEKNIRVSFVSGFKEFALFLNSLERHQPILFVNKFTLNKQNNDNTTYQVTVDIAAFVRKLEIAENETDNAEMIVGAKL